MPHLPPVDDAVQDVFQKYPNDLTLGLYTNPSDVSGVTQLSDLTEVTTAELPGYFRQQVPLWETVVDIAEFTALQGTAVFVASGAEPPAPVLVRGIFVLTPLAPPAPPPVVAPGVALVTLIPFPSPVSFTRAGDGVAARVNLGAQPPAVPGGPSRLSSDVVVIRLRGVFGKLKLQLHGQDLRMAQLVLKAVRRLRNHDARVPLLPPGTKRFTGLFLDPSTDPLLVSALDDIEARMLDLISFR